MTSGTFHSVDLTLIKVSRDDRQRRILDDIDPLADSLRRVGLIHPICITRAGDLVAGERRLAAARALGWTHIPCHYTDELDPIALRAIELEENVKRRDLPWEDECKAVNEFHLLQKANDPEWNTIQTAEALGLSPNKINDRLLVAKELLKGNSRVIAAPKFSTARGIIERQTARENEAVLESLRAEQGSRSTPSIDESPIITADFIEWSQTYSGPKFNFIHCDFPYGIESNKNQQGGAVETHGGYEDTEDTYWNLCRCLARFISDHGAESLHIMFWFSMHYYSSTILFFRDNCNIHLDPFPLLWTKSDNIGLLPDPQRGPRRVYETAFFGSRGDRKIVSAVSNAFSGPTDRSTHMSLKPQPMLSHYFKMFVDSTTIFLDPTTGSGSSVRAALSGGAKLALGIEKNPEFAALARLSLAKGGQDGQKEA